jgi:hypothetical protein
MPNPLDALRKAETIGAGPREQLVAKVNSIPVTQSIMPMLPGSILNGLRGLIGDGLGLGGKVAPKAIQAGSEASSYSPVAETLGEINPEFTPATSAGESMYNAGRQGIQKVIDPLEAAYQRLKMMGGR